MANNKQTKETMKKLLKKITRRILKDEILAMTIPKPEAIIIPPEGFKRYRAQRIVPYQEHLFFENREEQYIKSFRFDIANELLNEIIIKAEEVPEGVMYSCNLLMKNV